MTVPEHRKGVSFWALQIPGWLLLIYLIFAQGISAFSYDIGVEMGTQEPFEMVTEVGAAFWYGFAFGDLLVYIPVLLAGLIGHFRLRQWGYIFMSAGLGITVYWPIVCLSAMVDARDAHGWNIVNETPYWVVLLLITAWGLWGLFSILRSPRITAPENQAGPALAD